MGTSAEPDGNLASQALAPRGKNDEEARHESGLPFVRVQTSRPWDRQRLTGFNTTLGGEYTRRTPSTAWAGGPGQRGPGLLAEHPELESLRYLHGPWRPGPRATTPSALHRPHR